MSDFIDDYRVGLVLSLEGCGSKSKGGKALKVCKVNIGHEDPITIVTSASNVREGSRLVVAPLGSSYLDHEDFEVTVEKSMIGNVVSEGVLCDSKMLGWTSGGRGVAAILPYTFDIGTVPPPSKPKPPQDSDSGDEAPPPEPQGLFEKKLSKEEKKRLAEERRRARKAAKSKTAKSSNGPEVSSCDDVNGNDHDNSR